MKYQELVQRARISDDCLYLTVANFPELNRLIDEVRGQGERFMEVLQQLENFELKVRFGCQTDTDERVEASSTVSDMLTK